MKVFRTKLGFCLAMVATLAATSVVSAQERPRVVGIPTSRPIATAPTSSLKKPVLSSPVGVEPSENSARVTRTALTAPASALFSSTYGSLVSSLLIRGIETRWGIPYRLGSTGPNRYDCSGFIWSVFTDAGFDFPRSSARNYWDEFEPAEGAERFKFGTLVFFNKLGHVGIVADENGFYHASRSNGITYSPFSGYWEKRITGFRKVPSSIAPGNLR